MPNTAYFRRLCDYNAWANRRLWDAASQLNDEQFSQPHDYSIGSVKAQIAHIIWADTLWLNRVLGENRYPLPAEADYPDRESLWARWEAIGKARIAFIEGLKEEDLQRKAVYFAVTDQQEHQTPLDEALGHIINHSTDHRAQTLALINTFGISTPPQDMIYFTWEFPRE